MQLRSLLLAVLCTLSVSALAQETPRQLNTLPGAPTPPPATTPIIPPATSSPAVLPSSAVAPADTARRVATEQRAVAAPPAVPDSEREQQQQRRQQMAIPSANTTRYAVGLKTGQVVRGYDVEIKQPVFGRSFLLIDGQQRFELDQVRYYEDETGFYVRTTLPGRSSRESTLRRDRVGRISLYSITSTQYMNNPYGGLGGYGFGRYGYGGYPYGGYPYGGYRTVKTDYFSKDNGPIENLTLKNLQLATADNPGSVKLLQDARRYQTYTTLSYIAAGGLMLAGTFSSFSGSNGFAVSPLVYAAIPLAIVPLVIGGKQQNNIKQAILLYNRGQ
ncbi:hypothetical protein [Hymenobacter wooponensis]|uniref:Uncharacterized protein n=1 Tax=Hymenobacter wooponensis TaxID=1525360 RepID=A0A4Z0MUY1_9BACT|nr:hypothetical protein [Hymenobacter wooponensis]TGD83108.1 hypothetical protein EU557_04830 [Hymenobacter wooponensis]